MDPASATMLFLLFLATEKAVKYAGGKVADAMTKPIWEALEEKAKWLAGKDDTAKRWQAFVAAFEETSKRLETNGRHPELAKQVAGILNQFDLKTQPDDQWLDELAVQLEKASLVNQRPDETILVELFNHTLSKPAARAELSEVVADFVAFFKDALFAQNDYQELMRNIKQWEDANQNKYDTRERYLSQVIAQNKNLDFVGIPGLKDGQGLGIEDIYISLQTQVGKVPDRLSEDDTHRIMSSNDGKVLNEILGKYNNKTTRTLSVNQALAENSKLVVLGDPGSGKTTLLKYIVLAYAQNKADKFGLSETKLPIFIRMYDYVAKRAEVSSGGFSFIDYLYKYCIENLTVNLPPRFFEDALEKGECCICLDGLDELGSAGLRREINLAVSALRSRYSRNRFIITSRIVGYEEAPLDKNEFMHHTVQPLSDDDIKSFVEKWYFARPGDAVFRRERTKHLIDTIMNKPRIKELASNPLMLTIIALVHRNEAELPNERVQLYEKCVSALIEKWDAAKLMKSDAKINRRRLERIAYWMHSQPGEKGRTREVRESKLRDKIIDIIQKDPKNNLDEDQILSEAENFINIVKSRSGLLVERGDDIYAFSHLTFQEYLTACDIEKRCSSPDKIWEEIKPKLHDAHWREVILLLLGSLNKQDEHNTILVRNILDQQDDYESVLHRNLLLASHALSDHVEVDVKLHDQIVDSLLALLDSPDYWIRDIGFETLGKLRNDPHAANGLLALAGDEKVDAGVRRAAAQSLGQLGGVDEACKLLLVLAGDEKVVASERIAGAQSLGQLGCVDEACKLLLTLAGDEKVPTSLRGSAVQVLGQLEYTDEVARRLLVLGGDQEKDGYIRVNVVQALVRSNYKDEVARLFLNLSTDNSLSDNVRYFATWKLGQFGYAEKAAQLLFALVRDDEADVVARSDSALALGFLGYVDQAILNGLLDLAIDKRADVRVSRAAIRALGDLGHSNKVVMIQLLKLATDEKTDSVVRTYSAEALIQLGYADQALSLLPVLVMDEKVGVVARFQAATVLGNLGRANKEVTKLLLAIAGDAKVDNYVRFATAWALGQIGHKDIAAHWLLVLAEDEKVSAIGRRDAAQALGQLGRADEAGKLLLALAGDEKVNAYVRFSSFEALKKLLG